MKFIRKNLCESYLFQKSKAFRQTENEFALHSMVYSILDLILPELSFSGELKLRTATIDFDTIVDNSSTFMEDVKKESGIIHTRGNLLQTYLPPTTWKKKVEKYASTPTSGVLDPQTLALRLVGTFLCAATFQTENDRSRYVITDVHKLVENIADKLTKVDLSKLELTRFSGSNAARKLIEIIKFSFRRDFAIRLLNTILSNKYLNYAKNIAADPGHYSNLNPRSPVSYQPNSTTVLMVIDWYRLIIKDLYEDILLPILAKYLELIKLERNLVKDIFMKLIVDIPTEFNVLEDINVTWFTSAYKEVSKRRKVLEDMFDYSSDSKLTVVKNIDSVAFRLLDIFKYGDEINIDLIDDNIREKLLAVISQIPSASSSGKPTEHLKIKWTEFIQDLLYSIEFDKLIFHDFAIEISRIKEALKNAREYQIKISNEQSFKPVEDLSIDNLYSIVSIDEICSAAINPLFIGFKINEQGMFAREILTQQLDSSLISVSIDDYLRAVRQMGTEVVENMAWIANIHNLLTDVKVEELIMTQSALYGHVDTKSYSDWKLLEDSDQKVFNQLEGIGPSLRLYVANKLGAFYSTKVEGSTNNNFYYQYDLLNENISKELLEQISVTLTSIGEFCSYINYKLRLAITEEGNFLLPVNAFKELLFVLQDGNIYIPHVTNKPLLLPASDYIPLPSYKVAVEEFEILDGLMQKPKKIEYNIYGIKLSTLLYMFSAKELATGVALVNKPEFNIPDISKWNVKDLVESRMLFKDMTLPRLLITRASSQSGTNSLKIESSKYIPDEGYFILKQSRVESYNWHNQSIVTDSIKNQMQAIDNKKTLNFIKLISDNFMFDYSFLQLLSTSKDSEALEQELILYSITNKDKLRMRAYRHKIGLALLDECLRLAQEAPIHNPNVFKNWSEDDGVWKGSINGTFTDDSKLQDTYFANTLKFSQYSTQFRKMPLIQNLASRLPIPLDRLIEITYHLLDADLLEGQYLSQQNGQIFFNYLGKGQIFTRFYDLIKSRKLRSVVSDYRETRIIDVDWKTIMYSSPAFELYTEQEIVNLFFSLRLAFPELALLKHLRLPSVLSQFKELRNWLARPDLEIDTTKVLNDAKEKNEKKDDDCSVIPLLAEYPNVKSKYFLTPSSRLKIRHLFNKEFNKLTDSIVKWDSTTDEARSKKKAAYLTLDKRVCDLISIFFFNRELLKIRYTRLNEE